MKTDCLKEKSGVVILTFNNSDLVETLTDCIIEESIFDYIVIVDNCSTDDTATILKSRYINNNLVQIVVSRDNGGYAKGNNIGARELLKNKDIQFLFFANPDVIISAKTVDQVIGELKKKQYALVAPVMLKRDKSVDEYNYWDEPTYKSELLDCFYLYKKMTDVNKRKQIDYTVPVMDVFAVTGSFFGISRDAFIFINGFDEGTFLFCEENIIGTKLKRSGLKTGILTGASYIHNHSTIIDKSFKAIKKLKIQQDSHFYYVKTYITRNIFKLALLKLAQKILLVESYLKVAIRKGLNI